MGTNYYLEFRRPVGWHFTDEQLDLEADHAQADPVSLHIGKSSVGWVFGLHVIPALGIGSLSSWITRITEAMVRHEGRIVNEYGNPIDFGTLMDIICLGKGHRELTPEWLRENGAYTNHSARGLARRNTAKPGPGAWDLCSGRFS